MLHLQLQDVRAGGSVRVYARSKRESLEEAVFFLDPHINVFKNTAVYKDKQAYRPTPRRYTISGGSSIGGGGGNGGFISSAGGSTGSGGGDNAAAVGYNYSASKEFATLSNIPAGDHVLTVVSNPHNPMSVSSLSHIVVF